MGALDGIRVIEMAGLAPVPYCGMILADFGADVLRVDRVGAPGLDLLGRGKRSVALNMKDPKGVETLLRLVDGADVLIDPFRPGVMERLGAGPELACARNSRLVYARLTGYGQTGPYANMAGHDIDYIAISGALSLLGRQGEKPLAPVNLLGDFAGGGMACAMGIGFALVERARSGRGQVIDAAMVDGAAHLASFLFKFRGIGHWSDERGTNFLDGAAPFYDTYRTKDGKFVAVGAIEPQFYAALLEGLGLSGADLPDQHDEARWPELREHFTTAIRTKTRDEWEQHFSTLDACVAPALTPLEAPTHPHNVARGTFLEIRGVPQPAPAPRFGGTPTDPPRAPEHPGDNEATLAAWGFTNTDIKDLREAGTLV
jgi:alpha-methylacyl-CoA racemase